MKKLSSIINQYKRPDFNKLNYRLKSIFDGINETSSTIDLSYYLNLTNDIDKELITLSNLVEHLSNVENETSVESDFFLKYYGNTNILIQNIYSKILNHSKGIYFEKIIGTKCISRFKYELKKETNSSISNYNKEIKEILKNDFAKILNTIFKKIQSFRTKTENISLDTKISDFYYSKLTLYSDFNLELENLFLELYNKRKSIGSYENIKNYYDYNWSYYETIGIKRNDFHTLKENIKTHIGPIYQSILNKKKIICR